MQNLVTISRAVDTTGELPPDKLDTPSTMLDRPGRFFRWIGRLFFSRVTFADKWVDTIRRCSEEGTPVYIAQNRSLLDYLYFNWAFLKFSLPLARFANAVNTMLYRRLWDMIRFFFRYYFGKTLRNNSNNPKFFKKVLENQYSAQIFLKSPRHMQTALFGERLSDYLRILIEVQRGRSRPLMLIPQMLNWSLNPDHYRRNIFDILFGHPNRPGRLRKIGHFLYYHRRAFVQLCEPINLQAFLQEHRHLHDDLEALVEKLRYALTQRFSVERKMIRGPVLKRAKRLKEEILENKELNSRIHEIAEKSNREVSQLRREAGVFLDEIAADYKSNYIEFLNWVLPPVWSRIYAGVEVDLEGLEWLKDASKEAPLIIVPSHKSHMDYLLISWLFYDNGLVPPHIAAGNNLNFWPMGHIFRHCGAFFLRRRFSGQELYTLVFRHYLRKLIKEGFAIEFFIEGGRSRSGKVLPPKLGMLSFVVDAVLSGASRDIYFVPMSIDYESVVEEKSLMRELQGGEKEKENLTDLLKAPRVLWRKFGRIYAQFGRPISLSGFLEQRGLNPAELDESQVQQVVSGLGHQVVHSLTRIATATPSAIISLVLLSLGKAGLTHETMLTRIGCIIEMLKRRGARLSKSISEPLLALEQDPLREEPDSPEARYLAMGTALEDIVGEVLHMFSNRNYLTTYQDGHESLYKVVDAYRIHLDYYKNQIVHYFVDEAIVATAFAVATMTQDTTVEQVRSLARDLSLLLKIEFHFPTGKSFEDNFDEALDSLRNDKMLRSKGDALAAGPNDSWGMPFYYYQIRSFLESTWVACSAASRYLDEPMQEKAFIKRCQVHFQRMLIEGQIRLDEGVSKANFQNALIFLKQHGIIQRRTELTEKKKELRMVYLAGTTAEIQPLIDQQLSRIRRFLSLTI